MDNQSVELFIVLDLSPCLLDCVRLGVEGDRHRLRCFHSNLGCCSCHSNSRGSLGGARGIPPGKENPRGPAQYHVEYKLNDVKDQSDDSAATKFRAGFPLRACVVAAAKAESIPFLSCNEAREISS